MTVISALLLGIVEGVTEFLPISSTAHLIVASKLLNISQTEFQKFFEVFIQAGAILAVILVYWQYLWQKKELSKKIITSFLPTAIIGFLLYKIIKQIFFQSNILMIISIFTIGVSFLILEKLVKRKKIILSKTLARLSFKEAAVIGLCQSLAVVPGVSRAGIVMLTMMVLGYRRDESATYSFILAVPTIIAASFFDLYKMRNIISSSQNNLLLIMVGFLVAFVTAYFVIRWLITYLKHNSLAIFGVYRVVLAIILVFLHL